MGNHQRHSCQDCSHARVSAGEICYCARGYWSGRQNKHMPNVKRACSDFDTMDDEGEDTAGAIETWLSALTNTTPS